VYVFCSTKHLGKQSPEVLKNVFAQNFPKGPSAISDSMVMGGHAWIIPKNTREPDKAISALLKVISLPSAVKNECREGYLFHARQDVWSNPQVLETRPAYRFAKPLLRKEIAYIPYSTSDFLKSFADQITHSLKSHDSPEKWFSKIPLNVIRNVGYTVEHVTDYIKNHLEEIHTIEKLSQTLQKSRRHLDRLFQQKMHMTCSDYLRNLKMQQAAELLRDPLLSIKQIAVRVGLDAKAFSRAFGHFYGCSPRAMRKKTLRKKYPATRAL
jgi:AraC-like DNA-binding protein